MMPLKMATTRKPRNRLYQPSMIVGLKGTKTSSPSVPKTRRTATNVNGDISATATLIKRKEAPHNADKTKSTRYSLGFIRLILLSVENAVYHTKTLKKHSTCMLCYVIEVLSQARNKGTERTNG